MGENRQPYFLRSAGFFLLGIFVFLILPWYIRGILFSSLIPLMTTPLTTPPAIDENRQMLRAGIESPRC